jgi:hypothetical protein
VRRKFFLAILFCEKILPAEFLATAFVKLNEIIVPEYCFTALYGIFFDKKSMIPPESYYFCAESFFSLSFYVCKKAKSKTYAGSFKFGR